jgi:hypothetical protein
VWPSSSIARSKAIALRLACRGPPPLAI